MNIEAMKLSAKKATPGDWYISDKECETRRISTAVARSTYARLSSKAPRTSYAVQETKSSGSGVFKHTSDQVSLRVMGSSEWTYLEDRDAEFMVQCSPKNVLTLIKQYEELKTKLDSLQKAVQGVM